jgi:hypothetical protein
VSAVAADDVELIDPVLLEEGEGLVEVEGAAARRDEGACAEGGGAAGCGTMAGMAGMEGMGATVNGGEMGWRRKEGLAGKGMGDLIWWPCLK